MCATNIKVFCVVIFCVGYFHSTKCIYDPNDYGPRKPAMSSYGMKTIQWQGSHRQDEVQMHHNYSRVNVQKQKPNNESSREDDLVQQSSNFEPTILSSNLEDFNQQQKLPDELDEPQKVLNAHSYGVRPFESERYMENTQTHHLPTNRQYVVLNSSQSYKPCANNTCRTAKRFKRVEIHSKCPKGETGQFVFELSCNQYLNCWKGRGFVQNCAPGTLFNPKTLECDYAEKVYCLTGPRKSVFADTSEQLTEKNQATCPEGFSGIIPHYTNCSLFLNCDNGVEHIMSCGPGTLFDVRSNTCSHEGQAECVHNDRRTRDSVLVGNHQHGPGLQTLHAGYQGERGDSRFHHGYTNGFQKTSSASQNFVSETQGHKHGHSRYGSAGPHRQNSAPESQNNQAREHRHGFSSFEDAEDGSGGYPTGFNQHRGQEDVHTVFGNSQNHHGFNSYGARTDEAAPQQFDNGGRPLQGYRGSNTYSAHHKYDNSRYGAGVYQTNYGQPDYHQEEFTPQTHHQSHGTYSNFHSNGGESQTQYGAGRWVPNSGPYGQNVHQHGYRNEDHYDQTVNGAGYNENTNRNSRHNHNYNWHGHSASQNVPPVSHSFEDPKCDPNMVGLQPHPTDCSKFLNCANGITNIQNCGPGTVFNPASKVCDFPYNVNCKARNVNVQQRPNGNVDYDAAVGKNNGNAHHHDHDQEYGESNVNFEHAHHQGSFEDGVKGHRVYRTTTKPPTLHNFPNEKPLNTDHGQPLPHRGNDLQLNYEGNFNKFSTPSSVNYIYEYDDDIILDPKPDLATDDLAVSKDICGSNRYACSENQCVFASEVCDGVQDCSNERDEINCTVNKFNVARDNKLAVLEKDRILNATAVSCAKYCLESSNFTCRSFNYRKLDGACCLSDKNVGLSGSLLVNNIYDYYEFADYSIDCKNLYTCPNNKCISYNKVCDGKNDCGDRSDEKHCSAVALGYSLRLVGSEKQNEGTVEVTAFGRTGFICDDEFGLRDADVVCKELGYSLGALEVKANSYYVKGSRENTTLYMMDDVACLGNETSLRDCDFSGWGVHNCVGQEVVGVVCKTQQQKCQENYWKCDTRQECIPLTFLCDGVFDCADASDEASQNCEAPVELRLANGSSPKEGRVEVKYHGTWGTICDDDFNEDAAKVVCSSLGYKGSALVKKEGYFGAGKGPIWLDQIYCQGNETSVQECVHWDWGEHNCEHSEDVGVICGVYYDVPGTARGGKNSDVNPKVAPLAVSPDSCGYRKDNQFLIHDDVHFRVVKGSQAKKGDYPWQASIRVKSKSKPAHWCGAVVISQKFVLTAAHCLAGFAKGAYFVVAGDYNVDEEEGTEQQAYIEEFYVHEGFRVGQKMNNDIALIKLKGHGFTLTEDVQPICLPDEDLDYEKALNCTISGFGSVQSGKAAYSHDLRAGWIPLQPRDVCKMPHVYGSAITEGMICAGSLDEGVDACDGDSGGPLACLHDGLFTLYGMTSWGQHCGYANKPGVYVKIAHYRKWIDEKIRKHS